MKNVNPANNRPPKPKRRPAPAPSSRAPVRGTSRPGSTKSQAPRAGESAPKTGAEASGVKSSKKPQWTQQLPRFLSVRFVIVTILLLTTFSFLFPTIRAYIAQQQELAQLQADIAATQAENEFLTQEIARWGDDDYVAAQARERLGYVKPGQRLYYVVDPETVTGDSEDSGLVPGLNSRQIPWYHLMWESIRVANENPEAEGDGNE